MQILRDILNDSESLASPAVDAAAYYKKNYADTSYLDGLEAKRRGVERCPANLVEDIEKSVVSDAVAERLAQLEEQRCALNEAIRVEDVRAALCEGARSIGAYFERLLRVNFSNPATREQVLEYFIDKMYVSETGAVITSWYSGDHGEVPWGCTSRGRRPFC